MNADFLIGAIRASQDLPPEVSAELERILRRNEPMQPIIEHGTEWCAVCRNHIEKIGVNPRDRDNFCGRCGQAVKWE